MPLGDTLKPLVQAALPEEELRGLVDKASEKYEQARSKSPYVFGTAEIGVWFIKRLVPWLTLKDANEMRKWQRDDASSFNDLVSNINYLHPGYTGPHDPNIPDSGTFNRPFRIDVYGPPLLGVTDIQPPITSASNE